MRKTTQTQTYTEWLDSYPAHSVFKNSIHDRKKEAFLLGRGLRVLRFTNGQIWAALDSVVATVRDCAAARQLSSKTKES